MKNNDKVPSVLDYDVIVYLEESHIAEYSIRNHYDKRE